MGDYNRGPPGNYPHYGNQGIDMDWRQGGPVLKTHNPPGPQDPEHRKAITKLAEFVARNGPEFEAITKQKQEGNPKFAFLYYGGPFHEFYVSCVQCEIAKLKAEGFYDKTVSEPPTQGDPKKAQIRIQVDQLRKQITDSESNLAAQREAIPVMKETQLKQVILEAESEKIDKLMKSVSLDGEKLSELLDAMNKGKCSKDAISNCKKWILETCTTDQLREILMMYLLGRVKDPRSSENFRLHILYLVNDWAYHCNRKKLDSITQMLSRYVPQMYAFSFETTSDKSMQQKLEKLVGCWEGSHYFNDQCFKQLRNTAQIITNAKSTELAEYAKLANQIEVQLQAMYAGYEQQHKNYAAHVEKKIADLESELNEGQPRQLPPLVQPGRRSRFDQHSKNEEELPRDREREWERSNEPPVSQGPGPSNSGSSGGGFGRFSKPPPKETLPPDGDDIDGHPFDETQLMPKLPYYDLPAAIMCPLLKMETLTYDTLKPSSMRLPPPVPPSQTLIVAVDQFYRGIKTLDYPRDGNLWERDSLVDFFDRKMRLKQILQEKLANENKTLEDLITNKMSENDVKLMREDQSQRAKEIINRHRKENSYDRDSRDRSITPESDRGRERDRNRKRDDSRTSSPKHPASRSRSPDTPKRYKYSSRRSRSRTRSRSRSRSRTRSRSRGSTRSRSRSPRRSGKRRSRTRSRSDSRSPKRTRRSRSASSSPERPMFGDSSAASTSKRSPTPPRASFGAPISFQLSGQPTVAENKGAMLMQKMGWKGTGLGVKESGISEPITAGEVRDKTDQYRGLGNQPDQFEAYRKSRSSGYHERNYSNYMSRHMGQ
ncbi:hypothetical protein WR25_16033 [Diploscapter pachys]|uniref:G-patch domain-containing protein n=1 Tax=Diploscapter pachys TaxID=2018661 RepID=A0A2A2JA12_9BILA|nr:hypothetical protein WR25_16033 [Diploscapter pachys]